MLTVPVATVASPTHDYVKAIALLSEDSLEIQDRKGKRLATVAGTYAPVEGEEGKVWTFTSTEGETWTVTKMKTCGCGGTKVRER